ncbi:GTP-binding protein [Jonesia quinghaiensis]|uniref:GTP-binding protein n=1 Tax=Jonesia quinghaiensis TaxID=262806 RepID=UPI000419A579|nr:GTP-binding protein [Jonesia quinghaiensis]
MTPPPVILVTGTCTESMAAATMTMQWDLPGAVVVRHDIDVVKGRLYRIVSDASGVIEHVILDLEHACVSCAIREDIVPTLRRLSDARRWGAIIAHLPVGAEALQVCRVAAWDDETSRHLHISAVVTTINGPQTLDDLMGNDLLVERGVHSAEDDSRGVAETQCAMVEHADMVITVGRAGRTGEELLRALARPGVPLVRGIERVDTSLLMKGVHDHKASEQWIAQVRRGHVPTPTSDDVWTLDLNSTMPFHPERLLEHIERLGGHNFRARGCFWLPTRPEYVCAWDGAGGQLSIGTWSHWEHATPLSRIVVTGTGEGRDELERAFRESLVTDVEAVSYGLAWDTHEDGLEPWLGDIAVA